MKNKIIGFTSTKAVQNKNLKKEYEEPSTIIDDMNWIIKALEVGVIDSVDIIFKYNNEILYYGTNNDKPKNEIKQELLYSVKNLYAKAIIE
ncbi:hypothetical protein EXM63_02270 [Clostridium botulinum]|uniref:Uncharacterized protein n=1 Tax=Clostridium botulinum TaxID=1491 RepID=A0A6M0SZS6_CLOBO|nr:hypothetical protein [Clostridium botulinum]NFI74382.1 hypothetical protein [Clostridium sporogenes]NFP62290.1 hypothetical protein [Clostridium sporogenes]NFU95558.1 hypothetical protein [Clostridium sporogenes]NFV67891.1 hypothetical protein [Clostridium botulinum]